MSYRKPGQKAVIAMSMTMGHFSHPDDIKVVMGALESQKDDMRLNITPSMMSLMPDVDSDVEEAKAFVHRVVDEFFTHVKEGRDFGLDFGRVFSGWLCKEEHEDNEKVLT